MVLFFFSSLCYFFFFFFFQAEDGIRDDLVTGVQTCALPISANREANAFARSLLDLLLRPRLGSSNSTLLFKLFSARLKHLIVGRFFPSEIGRASCRERV